MLHALPNYVSGLFISWIVSMRKPFSLKSTSILSFVQPWLYECPSPFCDSFILLSITQVCHSLKIWLHGETLTSRHLMPQAISALFSSVKINSQNFILSVASSRRFILMYMRSRMAVPILFFAEDSPSALTISGNLGDLGPALSVWNILDCWELSVKWPFNWPK